MDLDSVGKERGETIMRAVVAINGEAEVRQVPEPVVEPNRILVRTICSAISPGTEIEMKKRAGASPVSLGYSAVGTVLQTGEGVTHVRPGDRVACYGAPYVKHAELLAVPKALAVPLPDSLSADEAAFVGLGAIAIHGLRQAELQFGSKVAVVGLGILGQLTCQIAEAAGYRVYALDLLEERCSMLRRSGLQTVFASYEELEASLRSDYLVEGADAVVLCAGGGGAELLNRSLGWLRDRGRIVIVGDMHAELSRELMFAKEAELRIARAGGPGRYDAAYEQDGVDYPIGFVRWTEGRNMYEYIRLLGERKIDVMPLVSKKLPVDRAGEAYEWYLRAPKETLGVLLTY